MRKVDAMYHYYGKSTGRCENCPCDLGWDHWSVEEARDAWNKRTEGKDNG